MIRMLNNLLTVLLAWVWIIIITLGSVSILIATVKWFLSLVGVI